VIAHKTAKSETGKLHTRCIHKVGKIEHISRDIHATKRFLELLEIFTHINLHKSRSDDFMLEQNVVKFCVAECVAWHARLLVRVELKAKQIKSLLNAKITITMWM